MEFIRVADDVVVKTRLPPKVHHGLPDLDSALSFELVNDCAEGNGFPALVFVIVR